MPKTSKSVSKSHSKYYTTLFPEEKMIEAFGHTEPTPSDRANYFKNMWEDWSDNQIVLPKDFNENRVHKLLEPHMKALFEWQVRVNMIETNERGNGVTKHWELGDPNHKYMKKALFLRFANSELKALARILLS